MAEENAPSDIQTQVPGGVVRPLYQERTMKCYVVTDSELKSLSLANGLMVIFFSLASASLGFAVDIAKDVTLATEVNPAAKVLTSVIQPVCYVAAVLFVLAGIWAYFWRRGAIAMIKRESGDTEQDERYWRRLYVKLGDKNSQ